jgi:DNA-binding LacI/PurR family transcriptional regulator
MPTTIKDIAERAGVSHSTVSRALRNSPLISEETTERIHRAALEMGYLPSAAARSLKTHRTHALGVVLSSIDDPFFSEILRGIEDVAQANEYSLFIAASQRNLLREQTIVKAMREHSVDGLIICSTSFSASQGHSLIEFGIPIVVVNNEAAEDYRYSIYHDDVDGTRQITRHLIELGHRKIAYLGNSLSGRTTFDRLTGFQQEMDAAGLPIPPEYFLQVPGGGPDQGLAGLDLMLDLPDRPTALICFNDMMAIGVLKGLQQLGIQVPAEFSVTGFDNIIFSAYTNPPLTTFDQPKRSIGTRAAEQLLALLHASSDDEDPNQPKIQMLQGRLLVRKSTASPSPEDR